MIHIFSPYSSVDRHFTLLGQDNENNLNLSYESQLAGGKGINLNRALRYLDTKARTYTLLGFHNGYKIKELCEKESINLRYIRTAAETREHIIVRQPDRTLTHIKCHAAPLGATDVSAYLDLVANTPLTGRLAVFSGALNPGFPEDSYIRIARTLFARDSQIKLIVDINGILLAGLLQADTPIHLVKINRYEWETCFNTPFSAAAMDQQARQHPNVQLWIVTDDEKPVHMAAAERLYSARPLIENRTDRLGAGDVFLGGFLAARVKRMTLETSLAWGIASASKWINYEKLDKQVIGELARRVIVSF